MKQVFNKGDKEYFDWMDNNPDGYILNTTKGKDTSYFVLHKSNCTHITKYDSLDDKAYTMRSYIKIASNDANEIIAYCYKHKAKFTGYVKICKTCNPEYIKKVTYPDEIEANEKFTEGSKKVVTVNAYERNSKARHKCIEKYGWKCQCCGLDFEKVYGEIGKGFIHVHHIKSISEIGKEYKIDPHKDLIPLCPNCHAMIHRGDPVFSLEELKEMIHQN